MDLIDLYICLVLLERVFFNVFDSVGNVIISTDYFFDIFWIWWWSWYIQWRILTVLLEKWCSMDPIKKNPVMLALIYQHQPDPSWVLGTVIIPTDFHSIIFQRGRGGSTTMGRSWSTSSLFLSDESERLHYIPYIIPYYMGVSENRLNP